MTQWMLALAAGVCCAALGAGASRRVRARQRMAREWADAMGRMDAAARRGDTLPEILRRGAGTGLPFLGQAADALAKKPAQASAEWLAGLPWDALLLPEEREALAECLAGLLAPDREGQLRALRRSAERWDEVVRRCQREWEQNGGLYRRLGWLSGAALFILLC